MIFSAHPEKLKEFYREVFGKKPDMDDGDYSGFAVGSAFLGIGPHDKVKGSNPAPERIMFNFETPDVKKEFERIKKLGAKVVAEPYQMEGHDEWIATLADPDGNYFQLMTPWEGEK